jgi:hypothetical protein
MTKSIAWDKVTQADVLRATEEYDRLGPDRFFSEHGFAPTTTYGPGPGQTALPAESNPWYGV